MEIITSSSTQETIDLGKTFAKILRKRDVILLEGNLGGGKTTFVKGILQGLGYKGDVLSPSFTIIRNYQLKNIICYHVDLYRLNNEIDFISIGLNDYLYAPNGITLIEWGEKIETSLTNYFKIIFTYSSETSRTIKLSLMGYPKERCDFSKLAQKDHYS